MTLGYVDRRRVVVRHEPCACGGVVVQHAGEAVEQVVAAHNATERHLNWRYRNAPLLHPGDPDYPYEEVML